MFIRFFKSSFMEPIPSIFCDQHLSRPVKHCLSLGKSVVFLHSRNPIKLERWRTCKLGWVIVHFLALFLNRSVSSSLLTFAVIPCIPACDSQPCLHTPADFPDPGRKSPFWYISVHNCVHPWSPLNCPILLSHTSWLHISLSDLTEKWNWVMSYLIPLTLLFLISLSAGK